jgi:hypothetical protein
MKVPVTRGARLVFKLGLLATEGFFGEDPCFLASVFTLVNVIGFSTEFWLVGLWLIREDC